MLVNKAITDLEHVMRLKKFLLYFVAHHQKRSFDGCADLDGLKSVPGRFSDLDSCGLRTI
jgi:hypothetical protein